MERKVIKCEACQAFFRNEFDKLNNTGAQKLDSIYRLTLNLYSNCIFCMKASRFCSILHNIIMVVIMLG